jgi:hypothetical protein
MGAPMLDQQTIESVRWAVTLVIPAAAGFGGVVVGALLTARRERRQRQHAYMEKQLSAFYSPMFGLRNEVRTHSALRVRIQNEASAAWAQVCSDSEHLAFPERQRITNERGPEFSQIIEYDNDKLHEELLPAYRKILALFRENYWLAEPETRSFYAEVVEFVEIWNRWVQKALPVEVFKRLQHTEERLAPFYEHIENKHDAIRAKLKAGAS